jgi:DNA-binding response OmpR family regulator
MKVLLIEDSPDIVESLALCFELRWPEIELVSVAEGKKGLKVVTTEPPDIVILDLGLPDIDGLDVLQQIRSFSKVPVIILTVRDKEMDKVKGLEMGADDYITKPFSPTEFLSRVKAVLRRSQMSESKVEEKPVLMGELRVDFTACEASIAGKPLNLTPEAYKLLLETLVQKNGHEPKIEELPLQELPPISMESQTVQTRTPLGQFVYGLKSFYGLFLDRARHLIPGKHHEHTPSS